MLSILSNRCKVIRKHINIDLNCTALRLTLFYVEVQTYMILMISKPYETIIGIQNRILRNIKTYFDLC